MKFLRILIIYLSFTAAFFLTAKTSYASEGVVELRSTTGDNYRCYTVSLQMLDLNYHLSVSCRDLLYPAGDEVFTYMVWANPSGEGKPIKLGELGFGRAQYKTKEPFSSLFVTTERDKRTKTPTGPVVMRGSANRIAFLEGPQTPILEEAAEAPSTATPSPSPSARERLLTGLRRAGMVALFALAAVIGLVFVLTRPKK